MAVVLWCAWVWVVFGPMQQRHGSRDAEVTALDQQRNAVLAGLSLAPALVMQTDSVTTALRRLTSGFARVDSIGELIGKLERSARDAGVNRAVIEPELACLMSIPVHRGVHATTDITLDTLRVELSVSGPFGAIGTWLERLEKRPDFQQWSGCEWAKGEGDGTVNFTGRAALWVVVPAERTP
jgi:hypothetical protein